MGHPGHAAKCSMFGVKNCENSIHVIYGLNKCLLFMKTLSFNTALIDTSDRVRHSLTRPYTLPTLKNHMPRSVTCTRSMQRPTLK